VGSIAVEDLVASPLIMVGEKLRSVHCSGDWMLICGCTDGTASVAVIAASVSLVSKSHLWHWP